MSGAPLERAPHPIQSCLDPDAAVDADVAGMVQGLVVVGIGRQEPVEHGQGGVNLAGPLQRRAEGEEDVAILRDRSATSGRRRSTRLGGAPEIVEDRRGEQTGLAVRGIGLQNSLRGRTAPPPAVAASRAPWPGRAGRRDRPEPEPARCRPVRIASSGRSLQQPRGGTANAGPPDPPGRPSADPEIGPPPRRTSPVESREPRDPAGCAGSPDRGPPAIRGASAPREYRSVAEVEPDQRRPGAVELRGGRAEAPRQWPCREAPRGRGRAPGRGSSRPPGSPARLAAATPCRPPPRRRARSGREDGPAARGGTATRPGRPPRGLMSVRASSYRFDDSSRKRRFMNAPVSEESRSTACRRLAIASASSPQPQVGMPGEPVRFGLPGIPPTHLLRPVQRRIGLLTGGVGPGQGRGGPQPGRYRAPGPVDRGGSPPRVPAVGAVVPLEVVEEGIREACCRIRPARRAPARPPGAPAPGRGHARNRRPARAHPRPRRRSRRRTDASFRCSFFDGCSGRSYTQPQGISQTGGGSSCHPVARSLWPSCWCWSPSWGPAVTPCCGTPRPSRGLSSSSSRTDRWDRDYYGTDPGFLYGWTDPYYTSLYGGFPPSWGYYYYHPWTPTGPWWYDPWYPWHPWDPDGGGPPPVTDGRHAWDRGPGSPSPSVPARGTYASRRRRDESVTGRRRHAPANPVTPGDAGARHDPAHGATAGPEPQRRQPDTATPGVADPTTRRQRSRAGLRQKGTLHDAPRLDAPWPDIAHTPRGRGRHPGRIPPRLRRVGAEPSIPPDIPLVWRPPTGARAAGMAGAYVAIADDYRGAPAEPGRAGAGVASPRSAAPWSGARPGRKITYLGQPGDLPS